MKHDAFPDVAELIPHARQMLLLSSVIEHDPDWTKCAVDVDRSLLFRDAGGGVPAWVGLEYLAQCIAVYGALVARAKGNTPRFGFFIGGRRLQLRVDRFRPGQRLHATVHHLRGDSGLVAFDGRIQDAAGGEPLIEGRLNVYSVESPAQRPQGIGSERDAS
jgi:predicted hotdog family 3-hydroxylacyl-ACP dehydratase